MRLRLLYVNSTAGKSAADIHVRAFVTAAEAAGHRVDLCSKLSSSARKIGKTRIFFQAWFENGPLRWVAYLLRDLVSVAQDYRRTRSLLRRYAAHAEDYDLIYARGGMHLLASPGRSLARAMATPLVLEINAFPDHEASLRQRPLPLKRWVRRNMEADLATASLVCVVSEALAEEVRRRMPQKVPILVNPNGVDHRQFHANVPSDEVRSRLDVESQDLLIGYAGSFQPWQGVISLIRAFSLIRNRDENLALRLVLIGGGEDSGDARRLACDKRVEDHIVFTGPLPHASMPAALAACDILVAPYERVEDFYFSPLKIFEYMALGKPIVASRTGQISEILTDLSNAMLVNPGDVEGLAEALYAVARDSCLREKLGEAAGRDSQRFTWAANFRRVEEAVRSLDLPLSEASVRP